MLVSMHVLINNMWAGGGQKSYHPPRGGQYKARPPASKVVSHPTPSLHPQTSQGKHNTSKWQVGLQHFSQYQLKLLTLYGMLKQYSIPY